MLKRAHDCRKTAENAAKALLIKLDGSCGGACAVTGCSMQPWESLSSNSHTSSQWRDEFVSSLLFFTSQDSGDGGTPAVALSHLRTLNDSDLAAELTNALRREKKLKSRAQELVAALERLTKSSEVRHQQSAEFVNDLKRANSNLVAAYEKAKKKHQNKLKKLESQMMAMVERHETQVRMLKQRIALLEEENSRPHTNETSL
ncbi:UNVERIFIED_CONTAM: hypothetical protein FKN15_038623 [Acipenser sinensis]